jgi:hypothetical protein
MLRTQKTALVPSNWVSISDIINPADDRDALRFNHRTKSRYRLEFVGANAIPFALGLRALVASRAKRLPARPPLSSRPRGQDPTLILASLQSGGGPRRARRPTGCHVTRERLPRRARRHEPTSHEPDQSGLAHCDRTTADFATSQTTDAALCLGLAPKAEAAANKNCGCDGPHAYRGAPRATISAAGEAAHATSVAATERTPVNI